jgi:hypothetical protein
MCVCVRNTISISVFILYFILCDHSFVLNAVSHRLKTAGLHTFWFHYKIKVICSSAPAWRTQRTHFCAHCRDQSWMLYRQVIGVDYKNRSEKWLHPVWQKYGACNALPPSIIDSHFRSTFISTYLWFFRLLIRCSNLLHTATWLRQIAIRTAGFRHSSTVLWILLLIYKLWCSS